MHYQCEQNKKNVQTAVYVCELKWNTLEFTTCDLLPKTKTKNKNKNEYMHVYNKIQGRIYKHQWEAGENKFFLILPFYN